MLSPMPKMKSTTDMVDPEDEQSPEVHAVRKLTHALNEEDDEGQLVLMMRIKNSRVDYTFLNRPDPTIYGVSDAVLLAALIKAGSSFPLKKVAKLKQKERREALRNETGDVIVYKDSIVIDFSKSKITSTRNKGTSLSVLSIVVQNLSRVVAEAEVRRPAEKPN